MTEVTNLRNAKLVRVSESDPCHVCAATKWCSRTADGKWDLCGHQVSDYGRFGSFGWIHPGEGTAVTGSKIEQGVPIDFTSLSHFYASQYSQAPAPLFGGKSYSICDPGIAVMVRELGVGWNGEAYTIPMYSPEGWVCGIQRRYPDGTKRMTGGSKAGVFIGEFAWLTHKQFRSLTIYEGASDLIHTYTPLAIGRLNCDSVTPVVEFVRRCSALQQIQIMADNDLPGLSGAGKLVNALKDGFSGKVKVYVPRTKDWRSHVEAWYGWDQLEVV
jgi:hypothetical protein